MFDNQNPLIARGDLGNLLPKVVAQKNHVKFKKPQPSKCFLPVHEGCGSRKVTGENVVCHQKQLETWLCPGSFWEVGKDQ